MDLNDIRTKDELRRVLTKEVLSIDDLHNNFGLIVLEGLLEACEDIVEILNNELNIVDTIFVSAVIMDDVKRVMANAITIKGAMNLNNLRIESICLN
jgi:hypothetical protein